MPSVASLCPASPVASRYEVVPLHPAMSGMPVQRAASNVHRLMDIVSSLQRTPRRGIAIAFVALTRLVGKGGGERTALRLDVRDHFPNHGGRQRASPRRHAFGAAFEDRLVD